MVRPIINRHVRCEPDVTYFKPQGVRLSGLERIQLNVEELEALRLKDYEQLDQSEAASWMDVSQPTFHRVYMSARRKVARALVEGLAIKIHGGAYKMPNGDRTGPMGKGPMTGRGMGPCETGQRYGRGFGRGLGRGFGRRAGFVSQPSKEEEQKALEQEREQIEKRLQELSD